MKTTPTERYLLILLLSMFSLGCGGQEAPQAKKTLSINNATENGPKSTPQVGGPQCPLSAAAQEVERLIDATSYEAAQRVFEKELEANPKDAGLLCQYVRYLVISRDPAYPDFIQSPLIRGAERYWAAGVAVEAAETAVQFDPKCKPYLVDCTLNAFAKRMGAALDEDRGCVGKGRRLFDADKGQERHYGGVELSMTQVCFVVLDIDPTSARKWTERYEALTNQCTKAGKVASAMMLGKLTGDLSQGRRGPEGFKRATSAFLESLTFAKDDLSNNWAKEAADAYPHLFRDEMLEIQKGKGTDPLLRALEVELTARGLSIPRASDRNPRNISAPTGVGVP